MHSVHRIIRAAWVGCTPVLLTRRCFSTAAPSAIPATVRVNGTEYRVPPPHSRTVAILIDGGSQEYLAAASSAGATPFLDSLLARGPGLGTGSPSRGIHALVSGQIPTLTNPNNVAIVCGAPASVTGISGNYFLDETVNPPVERLMNSDAFLRAKTIFSALQKEAQTKVTILTAKDKLLSLLGSGLDHSSPLSCAFSIEKLGSATVPVGAKGLDVKELTKAFYEYFESQPELLQALSPEQQQCIRSRTVPNIYNPHISLYLMELGLGLFKQSLKNPAAASKSEVFYLSTTDYVQHKYLPTDAEALRFYRYVDNILRQFDEHGAVLAFTADHGMNSKVGWDGKPKVVYIQTELEKSGFADSRVILPITDPYVKHHSSLGGYATVYFEDKDPARVLRAMQALRKVPGIYTVLNREEACKSFELPPDRVGDIVLLGDVSTVLGKRAEDHDLTAVPHLRSHGGMDEATVPMVLNRRLEVEYERRMTRGKVRNWHLFEMLLNGVKHD